MPHEGRRGSSLVFGPDSNMVVQKVGQVVGHQVFARHSDVHRVPVLKLPPQPLKVLPGNVCLGERRRLKEDKVPHVSCHLLWSVKQNNDSKSENTIKGGQRHKLSLSGVRRNI